jgi:hypothetical protein
MSYQSPTNNSPKFKYVSNYGGYFDQYQYIEDPGIDKVPLIKDS